VITKIYVFLAAKVFFVPQELLMPATFIKFKSVHLIVENTLHRFFIFLLDNVHSKHVMNPARNA